VLVPVEAAGTARVDGTDARVGFGVAAGRALPGAVVVFATGAGRVGVTFFETAALTAVDFAADVFGVATVFAPAIPGFFADAFVERAGDVLTDAGLRVATAFLLAAVRRAEAGFFVAATLRTAAAFFVTMPFRAEADATFRVLAFFAVALRAGAAAFFRAGFRFAEAFVFADAPDARAGVRRRAAAAREAGRADLADLLRADVPDLRGAGFLAISESFGLP
jgi:hypothetical protein